MTKKKELKMGELLKLTILICKRCRHTWYPRVPVKPKACPNCNSKIWYKERNIKNPTE